MIGIIGTIIGVLVTAAAIYYLVKDDKESRKIYSVMTAYIGRIYPALFLTRMFAFFKLTYQVQCGFGFLEFFLLLIYRV